MISFDRQVKTFIAYLEAEKSEIYVRINEDFSIQKMLKSSGSEEPEDKFNQRIDKLKAKYNQLKEAIIALDRLIK